MGRTLYTNEFKIEAVKQVTERGYTRKDVAERLGISSASLARWVIDFADGPFPRSKRNVEEKDVEIAQLKAQLKRVSEERDILKKAAVYFASNPE